MASKMRFFGMDECGDETLVYETIIPFADGELTDTDLELIFSIKLEREAHIADMSEWGGFWYETDYRTKEAIEREEEAREEEIRSIMEECDVDKEEAWIIYGENCRREWYGY